MILALDLATTTGFCYGRGDGALPVVGHVRLPKTGAEVGPYLAAFQTWLLDTLDLAHPCLVVFEAPFSRRFDRATITRKLHALPGLAELVCFQRHIEVAQVAPASAKKTLTGSGVADKDRMCAVARAYGVKIELHDEADAFAVWITAIRARVPDLDPRWMGRPA